MKIFKLVLLIILVLSCNQIIGQEKRAIKIYTYVSNNKLKMNDYFRKLAVNDEGVIKAKNVIFILGNNKDSQKKFNKNGFLTLDNTDNNVITIIKAGYISEQVFINNQSAGVYHVVLKKWYNSYIDWLKNETIHIKHNDNYYFNYLSKKKEIVKKSHIAGVNGYCIQNQWLILNMGGAFGNLNYVNIDKENKTIQIKNSSYEVMWRYIDTSVYLGNSEDLYHYLILGIFSKISTLKFQSIRANVLKVGYAVNLFHQTGINLYTNLNSSGPIFSTGYIGLGAKIKNKLFFRDHSLTYLGLNIGYQWTNMKYNVELESDYKNIVRYNIHQLFGEIEFKKLKKIRRSLKPSYSLILGFKYEINQYKELMAVNYQFLNKDKDFNNWSIYFWVNFPGLFNFF